MDICEIINNISKEAKGILKPDLIKYGKNYRAISESSILETLNPLFEKYKLFYEVHIIKQEVKIEKVNTGADALGNIVSQLVFVASVEVQLVFHTQCYEFSTDSYMFSFDGAGMGVDSGDKAMGKAITGAVKYALLKGFRLQYSDDPDAEASKEITSIEELASAKEEKAPKAAKNDKKSQKKNGEPVATEGQLSYIKGLVVKCGMSDSAFEKEFGCSPYDENIGMSRAREIIDRLKEIFENGLPF